MPVKWNIAVLMFFFGCTMLFAIIEIGAAPGAYTGTDSTYILDTLVDVSVVINPLNWLIAPHEVIEWIKALISAVTFNYAMFDEGNWQWIRYFFICIGLGWMISLIIAVGRGVGST